MLYWKSLSKSEIESTSDHKGRMKCTRMDDFGYVLLLMCTRNDALAILLVNKFGRIQVRKDSGAAFCVSTPRRWESSLGRVEWNCYGCS